MAVECGLFDFERTGNYGKVHGCKWAVMIAGLVEDGK